MRSRVRPYKRREVIVPRRFASQAPAPAKDGPRINEEIFSRTILLIGDDGHKYGEIGIDEAPRHRAKKKASTWSRSRPKPSRPSSS